MGKTAEIFFATLGLIGSLSTFTKAIVDKINDRKAVQKKDTENPDDGDIIEECEESK